MRRYRKLYLAGVCLVLTVLQGAAAAYFAADSTGRRETAQTALVSRTPISRPYPVTGRCEQTAVVRAACRVAIRYLHALDHDRFDVACSLLVRETLENAGGMKGCVATLESSRGIRIRYGIQAAVRRSFLGTSILFWTKAIGGAGPGTDQEMIVRPDRGKPRIWMVMVAPRAAADLS